MQLEPRDLLLREPADGLRLHAIGLGITVDELAGEDDRHEADPVAVRIRRTVEVAAEAAASCGCSPGSTAPPGICHRPSTCCTSKTRASPSRITTATEGMSRKSFPIFSRSPRT